MTQREIDRAAAIIRATPIEPVEPMARLEPIPFWRVDFPCIVLVLLIAAFTFLVIRSL